MPFLPWVPAFLHFACVLRSEDHHFARSEVQGHRSAGAHAFGRPVARESTGVVNRVVLRSVEGDGSGKKWKEVEVKS